ncbi:MAG: HNH endonuclease [Polaromonas sp.]|uniref:HNH endonuclease n=1 Tax=Polaromonas sp. TaxID=1869339 RepID=UPI00326657EB
MKISSTDWAMRTAAFAEVRRLQAIRDQLTSADLAKGFQYDGQRIPLVNPQRGIFKPRQMETLLSIKTVFPRPGGKIWYDDQRSVHKQIYDGEETVDYSFMGTDPDVADNRWLKEAMDRRVPILYFLGVSPGRYQAFVSAFIESWHPNEAKVKVSFGDIDSSGIPKVSEDSRTRRYALRQVKQRLHQASFRDAVISAYGNRCALSGMPEPMLLDAAHIISDGNEELGHAIVPNGIPLTKIHHAAFDAHLIGIDPDFRVHVSTRLLDQSDGPILQAMQELHGQPIQRPIRLEDAPDRDRLAHRFEMFRAAS